MSIWDNIKNIMTIPEDDEFEDEMEEKVEEPKEEPQYAPKKAEAPRIIKSKAANYNQNSTQMQVVLVKPDRFEDVEAIADHLNNKKTVVLNLEDANREVSRRIIDFLSGVAYANHGNIRKVANSTFIIVARDVDIMGELMLDDFSESKLYF
ncbi:MAG: cell division protein SepF [Clostridia bacterium]|nr:cell division protein SepF [Clostridia bacterium]